MKRTILPAVVSGVCALLHLLKCAERICDALRLKRVYKSFCAGEEAPSPKGK